MANLLNCVLDLLSSLQKAKLKSEFLCTIVVLPGTSLSCSEHYFGFQKEQSCPDALLCQY